jgi:hypothetical protein
VTGEGGVGEGQIRRELRKWGPGEGNGAQPGPFPRPDERLQAAGPPRPGGVWSGCVGVAHPGFAAINGAAAISGLATGTTTGGCSRCGARSRVATCVRKW